MPFTDLDELLEPWLDLPIRGKTYRVPSVDAATGLWCQRMDQVSTIIRAGGEVSPDEAAALKLDDDEEKSFSQRLLGTAYDEMLADGLPWEYVRHATRVAFAWTLHGRESAERLWGGGGRPESPPPDQKEEPATGS